MLTTYFKNLIAGNIFNTQISPAIPSKYYIGLSTTIPTVAGANVTEPSELNGYSRVELNNLSTPVDGLITNISSISFNESTGSWGDIIYYVIYDSSTIGSSNLLLFEELTNVQSVGIENIVTFKTGAINLQFN